MASFTTTILAKFKSDTSDLDKGTKKAAAGFKGLKNQLIGLTQGLRGMSGSLTSSGALFTYAGLAIRRSLQHYERLSRAQTNIRSTLATNNINVNESNRLFQHASALGRRFAFSTTEVTESLASMAEMGLSTDQMMQLSTYAMRAARGANIQLDTSIQLLVNTMRQYNMSAEDASRILPMFTIAARANSTSVQQAASAMRYAGTEAAGFGFNLESTIAAIAGLSQIGQVASRGGSSLRRQFSQMIRAAAGMNGVLNDLLKAEFGQERGMSMLRNAVFDTNGQLIPFEDSITNLARIIDQIRDPVRKQAALLQLFGMRGVAGGQFLGRLTDQTNDWRNALRTIRDPLETERRMTNTVNQAMQGFHIQMEQVRGGLEELSIILGEELVGALGTANQAFGSYFRDLVLAARYTDESKIESDELRAAFRELSPETRKQGQELRETIKGLAQLANSLAKVVIFFGKLVAKAPRVTALFVTLYAVLKPVTSLFGSGFIMSILKTSVAFTSLAGSIGAVSLALIAFMLAGAIGDELGNTVAQLAGVKEEYDALGEAANKWMGDSLNKLPVIAGFLRTIYRTGIIIRDIFGVTWEHLRSGWHEATTTSRREEMHEMSPTEAIRRESARRFEAGDRRGGRERMLASSESLFNRSLINLVAISKNQGNSLDASTRQLQTILRSRGASEEEIGRITDRFRTQFERMGPGSVQTIANDMDNMGVSIHDATSTLINFSRALETIRTNVVPGGVGGVSPATPERIGRDVSVTRTGFLPFPVSSGDMLVDRNELASAVVSNRAGSMIPSPPANRQVGPTSSQPIQIELTVETPVRLDGREIARAIGRHTLQVDQRRGGSSRPGTRRRVIEQGVM